MNFIKKTKIVATIGPKSSSKEIIEKMILSGVNVFRINFSHANYDEIIENSETIRSIDKKLQLNTAILADLQGPKLRIGKIKDGTIIKTGYRILFKTDSSFEGDAKKAYMNYKNFPKDVTKEERILLDDGKLILKIVSTNKSNEVEAEVIQGGACKSNKGVNLPNTKISLPALTEKDIKDAKFIFTQDIDWIALSFVRNSQDIIDLKNLMINHIERKIPIIAKIEKPEAIENIDKIIAYSDGLMVARGDLGVEMPTEKVPIAQKNIIKRCRHYGKPVVVATQMLESMISNLVQTRAEASDVANAIYDGTDAVMLSGESAMGDYPVESVATMDRIIENVEKDKNNFNLIMYGFLSIL